MHTRTHPWTYRGRGRTPVLHDLTRCPPLLPVTLCVTEHVWKLLKRKMFTRKEQLTSLQQTEAIEIRRKSDAFGVRVEEFRRFFQTRAPFTVPVSVPSTCQGRGRARNQKPSYSAPACCQLQRAVAGSVLRHAHPPGAPHPLPLACSWLAFARTRLLPPEVSPTAIHERRAVS